MYIGRTLPPAAVPFTSNDILNGLKGWYRGENEIEQFRTELRHYFGKRYCFLVSSGKAALFLILKALRDLRPHCDTVLIPAFNCYSVPSAIVRAGLKVGLCDIDPGTLDFDFNKLQSILDVSRADQTSGENHDFAHANLMRKAVAEDRLLAIIPTHLFGMTAEVDSVRRIIGGRSITLIEDAAQAFGARSNGRFLGCNGDIGFFSLGRGKSFSTVGGGVILTDRSDLAGRIETRIAELTRESSKEGCHFFVHAAAIAIFQHPSRYWLPSGLPFLNLGQTVFDPAFPVRPFTALQAGLARGWRIRCAQLRQIRERQYLAWRLSMTALDGLPVRSLRVSDNPGNLVRYPLRLTETLRTRILQDPKVRRLGVQPSYPDSIDGIAGIMGQSIEGTYAEARSASRELVTLPLHPYVNDFDRRKSIKLISSHLSRNAGENSVEPAG